MTRAVAALAVLLALVAIGSGVEMRGDGGGGLPPQLAAAAYAAVFAVAAASIPVLLVLAVRELPAARPSRRRNWLTPLALGLIAAAGVAASAYAGDGFSATVERLRLWQGDAAAATPPAGAWAPLAAVASLGLAGGVLALRRPPGRPAQSALAGRLAAVLGASLADLHGERDVRRAIVGAYARLETVLAAAGVERGPGDAPFEHVGRALRQLAVSEAAVLALAELYELARFSRHELGEDAKRRAISALEQVRAELR